VAFGRRDGQPRSRRSPAISGRTRAERDGCRLVVVMLRVWLKLAGSTPPATARGAAGMRKHRGTRRVRCCRTRAWAAWSPVVYTFARRTPRSAGARGLAVMAIVSRLAWTPVHTSTDCATRRIYLPVAGGRDRLPRRTAPDNRLNSMALSLGDLQVSDTDLTAKRVRARRASITR